MKARRLRAQLNTFSMMVSATHGTHSKDMIVLHETVSGDQRGLSDILGVEGYLARIGYGIHGMTDREGNIAWAYGLGSAVFYHCGGVNERSIGIEQVFSGADNSPQHRARDKALWAVRDRELRATARLVAAIARAHRIPLRYSDGRMPGITAHWAVSQYFSASEGHSDCHPIHRGGYYPILAVIKLARTYYKMGVRL